MFYFSASQKTKCRYFTIKYWAWAIRDLFTALDNRILPKAMNQLKHKQTNMETSYKRFP